MATKYQIIYNEIKQRISDEMYKDHDQQLPNEIDLCKEFDCSRMTVKKALDMLVRDGLIYRKKGKGSFILPKNAFSGRIDVNEDTILGFTRNSKKKVTSKVLGFDLMFATKEIAAKLDLKENDPVYSISRLRLIDNKPYVLEQTYMSPSLIPGIDNDILLSSIYTYIEDQLKLKIAGSLRITRAAPSNAFDQEHLDLKETEPVLEVEQVGYLDNGIPFDYSFARHRYDRFEFMSRSMRQY